jgi:amidase
VAVAANLCAVAVGTETNGSVSCPASMSSIVAIKPTVGLVSRAGIIPISKTQDTAGPMARTVTDAAILLSVLAGVDTNDTITARSKNKGNTDYTKFLTSTGLAGKRIGVEKTFLKEHEAIDPLLVRALEQMKAKGATIVELGFMELFKKAGVQQGKVLEYEFKDGVNKYLASANAQVKTLRDIINYNKQNEARVMPFFKQETLESSQAKGSLKDKEYIDALAKYDEARNLYNKFFDDNRLDAFCGPSNGFPWCVDPINGDFFTGYSTYSPAAICGFPSITVPMGSVNELPVGISFIGKAYSEPGLISIAYAYEQVSKNRLLPKFKKTFQGQV